MKLAALVLAFAFASIVTPTAHACMCDGCFDMSKGEDALKKERERLLAGADYVVAGFVTSVNFDVAPPAGVEPEPHAKDSMVVTHWSKFRLLPLGYAKGYDLDGVDIWLPEATSCDKSIIPLQYVALLIRENDGKLEAESSFCSCVNELFFPRFALLNAGGGLIASLMATVLLLICIAVLAWMLLRRWRKFS